MGAPACRSQGRSLFLEDCKTFINEFARRYSIDISFHALRSGRNTGVMQPAGLVVIGAKMLKALSGPAMKFVMAHEASHVWVEQHLKKQKGAVVPRGYRYSTQAIENLELWRILERGGSDFCG